VDYQVLALRWRPQRFEDVVGQDHITQVIAGAIEQDRVANAYLFSGPRGCGKTTTARILAKALNCEKGPTREPCGVCESCKSIAAGSSLAVQEIDAASNKTIEDVRKLRSDVNLSALEGRYKVYIIDEAHQIGGGSSSKDAAHALLKTLEEPPKGVVFILATTEPEKILATIRSRCQRFAFRLLRSEEIAGRLDRIAEADGLHFGEGVAMAMARKAEGSMRDGLTLLDQTLSSLGNNIELPELIELLGLPRYERYFEFTEACLARDGAAALRALTTVLESGTAPWDFALGLARHFRNLLLLKMDPALLEGELDAEEIEICNRLSAGFGDEDLLYLVRLASDRSEQIRRASQPTLLAEALAVELTRYEKRVLLSQVLAMLKGSGESPVPSPQPPTSGGQRRTGGGQRASGIGQRTAGGGQQVSGIGQRTAGGGQQVSGIGQRTAGGGQRASGGGSPTAIFPLSRSGLAEGWGAVVGAAKRTSMIKGQFLEKARPGGVDRDCFTLHLEGQFRGLLDNHEDRLLLQEKFREIFGESRSLRMLPPEGELEEAPAPRVSQSRADVARRERSLQEHSDNALVQDLLMKFDGEIVEDR